MIKMWTWVIQNSDKIQTILRRFEIFVKLRRTRLEIKRGGFYHEEHTLCSCFSDLTQPCP